MRMITVLLVEKDSNVDIRIFETGNGDAETQGEQDASRQVMGVLNKHCESMQEKGLAVKGEQHGKKDFNPID